jgi:uncharacterized membrane protein
MNCRDQSKPVVFTPWQAVGWGGSFLYLMTVVLLTGQPTPLAQIVGTGALVAAFGIAVRHHGWKGAGLLVGICLLITFTIENFGVSTGIPFGHYHFEADAGLPYIGAVPLIVGPLYFGVGYFAWIIAGILLRDADLRLTARFNVVALPIMAAFVMVQWDLVIDPGSSTLGHAWRWHDGGGYFGVPLSNYVGWYVTVWLVFQTYALMIYRWPETFTNAGSSGRSQFRLLAVLLYLAMALSQIVPYLAGGDSIVTDLAGQAWRAQDLRETTVIIMAFSMLPTGFLALILLASPPADHSAASVERQPI